MKTLKATASLLSTLTLVFLIGASVPNSAHARGHGGGRVKLPKSLESVITAVSSTSITTSVNKPPAPRRGGTIGGDGEKTTTKTYKITSMTDIQVNGEEADANALRVGMAVSISADAPDAMDAPDPQDGGSATEIIARDEGTGPAGGDTGAPQ